MQTVLLTIHTILSISLIAIILMQNTSSDGLSGLSGGSGSNAGLVSGRSAANILTKITYFLAFSFMVNCLLLAHHSHKSSKGKSIVNELNLELDKSSEVPFAE